MTILSILWVLVAGNLDGIAWSYAELAPDGRVIMTTDGTPPPPPR